MALLNIRNLSDDVHARLRIRAARHRRSMEAEARAIIEAACPPEAPALDFDALQAWVANYLGDTKPVSGVEELIRERREEAAREEREGA